MQVSKKPIGVFDSGYGGLTILDKVLDQLPEYDFIYLGDNARTPYGTRSFDVVYEYTREAVERLFSMGCELVILACNTASAKALRNIQQIDLPLIDESKRVLGVIRPSVEAVGEYTKTGHVGILATPGTVRSQSYPLEIIKLFPNITVVQEACPMWVPLVENNEFQTPGGSYFIEKHLKSIFLRDPLIDTLILGCTHYPILEEVIRRFLPPHVRLVTQGEIVAKSLQDYLRRHNEMDMRCSKGSSCEFYTTENTETFQEKATVFLQRPLKSKHISI